MSIFTWQYATSLTLSWFRSGRGCLACGQMDRCLGNDIWIEEDIAMVGLKADAVEAA